MAINFFRSLKLDEIKRIYYIFSGENYLKKEFLKEILKEIQAKRDTQIYKFDGKDFNLNKLINLCETVPLGSEYKTIVITDWEVDKLGRKDLDLLVELFSDLASFCCVIMLNLNISVLKANIKGLISVIKDKGIFIELTKPTQTEINKFIISEIRSKGCEISDGSAKLISEFCQNDLNLISCEIDKLISFRGSGKITQEDIKKLIEPPLEIRVFNLIDYINNREKKKAINLLKLMLGNREDPIMIISIMSMNFIDIYRAKVAINRGLDPAQLVKDFNYKSEYRVSKAYSMSKRYSFKQLKEIISILIDGDYKLKSSLLNKKVILERVLLKILSYLERKEII